VEPWSFPLFERVVDASRGVIVHNSFAEARLRSSRPSARIAVVTLPVPAIGIPDETPELESEEFSTGDGMVIGMFGHITPHKCPDVALRAFQTLRLKCPNATLVLVGPVSPYYDLEQLLDEFGEGVFRTGYVGVEAFRRYMASVDFAINLRHPTGGESSATVMELMSMGKPTIVTNHGSFAELPEDCCIKIDRDVSEIENVAEAMHRLGQDAALRARIGENARRRVAEHHQPAAAARAYLQSIREMPALPSHPHRGAGDALFPNTRELSDEVIAEVGAALADLGIADSRDELLSTISETLLELRLS